MHFYFFGAVLAVTLWTSPVSAQIVQYHDYDTIDNVRIEYRWQRASFFQRNPPALLNLKLTNLSDAHVEIRFAAGFYRDEQLFFESSEQLYCLEPWESIRGGRASLRFEADGVHMDTTEEDWFSWDMPFIEVRVVDSCDQ